MVSQEEKNQIEKNWLSIQENIKNSCEKSNRSFEDITVIAVTKTVEADVMNASLRLGIDHFGENRVQEVLRKIDDIEGAPHWHLIGHLQTNKVKYIVPIVEMIHSVDSLKLAQTIDKYAKKHSKVMKILLQVDMAEEDSKFGLKAENVDDLLDEILRLENIEVHGLMFIAPYVSDLETIRPHFKNMKVLFDRLKEKSHPRLKMETLSMGMTNDYQVAIEEGATMLRIGTGIFGSRQVD